VEEDYEYLDEIDCGLGLREESVAGRLIRGWGLGIFPVVFACVRACFEVHLWLGYTFASF
jgi:hypothetical protein